MRTRKSLKKIRTRLKALTLCGAALLCACSAENAPEEKTEKISCIAVCDNGSWGYLDTAGKYIAEPQFYEAHKFSDNGVALVWEFDNFNYSYINSKGAHITDKRFSAASDFGGEELAPVEMDGAFGYIDKKGKFAVEPKFYNAYSFSPAGLAPVSEKTGEKQVFGYIDKTGEYAFEKKFDLAYPFAKNGLALVAEERDGEYIYGYIDSTGNYVLEGYTEAESFGDNGYAIVSNKERSNMLINSEGRTIIISGAGYCGDFYEGLALVIEKGMFGYIDRSGRFAIEPEFQIASEFNDSGLAYAGEASPEGGLQLGFIDKTGEYVIPMSFADVYSFSDGLAPVKETADSKWGYINKSGMMVIEPQYDAAYSFSNGLAVAAIGGKYGYIDKTGQFVIEPQYDGAGDFSSYGAALVVSDRKCGIIKKDGSLLCEQWYDDADMFEPLKVYGGRGDSHVYDNMYYNYKNDT